MFSMLDENGSGRLDWEVAQDCWHKAGGPMALELPGYARESKWSQDVRGYIRRLESDGWIVSIVSSMAEVVENTRRFSRANYV